MPSKTIQQIPLDSAESLRQISLSGSHVTENYQDEFSEKAYARDLQCFRQNLLSTSSKWTAGYAESASPLPLLVPESVMDHLDRLGDVLCRAITSIVERWWTDPTANFSARMPLLPHQEAVLRWMDEERELMPSFATRRGAWRPDFLLNTPGKNVSEADHQRLPASTVENPQICEINARFSFNGFFCTAFAHEAHQKRGFETLGLKSPVEPTKVFDAFKAMFDLSKPIHLLKGTEAGYDIHLFADYLRERCGLKVQFVKPEHLRLVPNNNGKGSTVYCASDPSEPASENDEDLKAWRLISPEGEVLEQIHQVGLELHQWEMQELGEDMLKALAPLCFNDLRTIYLVHDKRMLGIVLQELESLVKEHMVLTTDEAETLRNGIVPTILPGSREVEELIQHSRKGSEVKDNYLMKPIGGGKGHGILFGTDVTTDEWIESLLRLSEPRVVGQNYVVQRVVTQQKFDVVMTGKNGGYNIQHNPFVGTFMMLNGEQLGIACWRTGPERICAVSRGGTWMTTLMRDSSVAPAPPITTSNAPRLVASSLDDSKNALHVSTVNTIMQKHGILIVTLAFPDPSSTYLLNLVQGLQHQHSHGEPLTHSFTRGWFWDVKPTPKSASKQFHARSETMGDFPWHTDCSYASEPPRFFGLHVLQADRCGGGTLSVVQLSKVLRNLSKDAVTALCAQEFRIEVPPEFENGTKSIVGSVLKPAVGGKEGLLEMRCRYRADIIHPLTERAKCALEDLDKVLGQARTEDGISLNLTPQMLPNGSVVLMDNARWLHARNNVQDPERHLRRIRWDATEF